MDLDFFRDDKPLKLESKVDIWVNYLHVCTLAAIVSTNKRRARCSKPAFEIAVPTTYAFNSVKIRVLVLKVVLYIGLYQCSTLRLFFAPKD